MKNFKNVAIRATALLIFFAMIAAVILYQAGFYEISFIKRPLPPVTDTGEESESAETSASEDTTSPPPSTTDFLTSQDPETSLDPEDAEQLLSLILSLTEMEKSGWQLSLSEFGLNSSIARLDFDFGEQKSVFSNRTETVTKTTLTKQENGLYELKELREKKDAPTVRLYYGLIFLDNGSTVSVWNSAGKRLIKNFTGALVYARSQNGNPVVQIKDAYYEIDSQDGLSKEISEDQIDFKAIRYDSPIYYAVNEENLYPFCEYVDVYTEITTEPPTTEPPATEPEDTESEPSDSSEEPPPSETDSSDPEQTEPEDTDSTEPEDSSDVTVPDSSESESEESSPENTSDEISADSSSEEASDSITDSVTASLSEAANHASDSEATEPDSTNESDSTGEDSSSVIESDSTSEDSSSAVESVTYGEGTVELDGKLYSVETLLMWGYRNAEGKVVIEPQYQSAHTFSEGLAAVTDFDNRLFFIDTEGNETVSLRNNEVIKPAEMNYVKTRQLYYDAISSDIENVGMYYFDKGYAMVRYVWSGTKYTSRIYLNENRLVDPSGNYFDIPVGYSLISYSDGILLLERDGKYGYMDTDGGWVKAAVYTEASPFVQGLAVVGTADGKYGLIDTAGNAVLPLSFDYISNVSGGMVCTYEETRGWEIYCIIEPNT